MIGRQALGQIHPGHLDVAEDRGQEIVEVVRYAAGESADAVHLLRLQ